MLKVRVSRPYDDLKEFIEKLADACEVLVVYEHQADDSINRTHIHAYVEDPKVSTDTMKNWVKKVLKVTSFPKSDWSFTEARDRGFITYLSKGQLDPLFVKGIEVEACRLLKADWVEQPQKKGKIQYILKAENPQERKMRQAEMIAEIRRRIHTDAPVDDLGYHNIQNVLHIITDVVVRQNQNVCGRYKIRDYYDTVMALENSHHHHTSMVNFLNFKS